MNQIKDALKQLGGNKPSAWKEKALQRRDNKEWLKKSQAISARILEILRSQGITQKQLAERMQISPQQVHKILQGQENLTLQTVTQLEAALGVTLIYVLDITPSAKTESVASALTKSETVTVSKVRNRK